MSVVVLHDLGDAVGGAALRAVAPIGWVIPDLPGHGDTPGPQSGHYDPMSAAAIARWKVARDDSLPAVLVGIRENAHAALVCAVAGASSAVVIIDGLWGPWQSAVEHIDAMYSNIRAIADDPAAVSAPPASGPDPRAKYGYGMMASATFLQQFWGAIHQPVLAIETPRSKTPIAERATRVSYFAGPASVVELADDEPASIVGAILDWQTTLMYR